MSSDPKEAARGRKPAETVPWSGLSPPPPAEPSHDSAASRRGDEEPQGPRLGPNVVLEELGRGGMGVVYRAWHRLLRREVALKVMSPQVARHPDLRRRFLREARACASLRHPNIVEVLEVGEDGDTVWFTMPMLSGPPLSEKVKGAGRLSPQRVSEVGARVAEALHFAHLHGVIHRDVKPGNVMLDGDRPVLMDFGLVKLSGEDTTQLTQEAQVIGTAAYMAPELLEGGADQASPASDQYALGASLYACLCGERPHAGRTPAELIGSMLSRPPTRLESRGVPPALARVVHRALARDPWDRYPDLNALREALESWEEQSSVAPLGRDLWARLKARARRPRPAGLVISSLLVASLLGLGVQGARGAWLERAAEQRRAAMHDQVSALEAVGDHGGAQDRFLAFTNYAPNAETRALPRAWLRRGEALLAAGRQEEAMEALTTAYVLSEERAEQRGALEGLASLSAQERRWRALEAISLRLTELGGRPRPDAERARLTASGAFAEAAALPGEPTAEVLRALAGATPLDEVAVDAAVLPGAPDRLVLVNPDAPSLRLLSLSPTPELLGQTPWPSDHKIRAQLRVLPGDDDAPSALLTAVEGECQVQEWREGALVTVAALPCDLPMGAARVDLDGDGRGELYLADKRSLLQLLPDGPGRLRGVDAHPATSGAASLIYALLPWRAGGRERLAVGVGPWHAYDLRVLSGGEGGLAMQAREQLGVPAALTSLELQGRPLLAALQHHDPSALIDSSAFGPAAPHGRERGLHLYALGPGGLEHQGHILAPERYVEPGPGERGTGYLAYRLTSGDLNGDGDDELILSQGFQATEVYTWRPAEGWVSFTLDGFVALLAADADGDGDDELLVRSVSDGDRLWWLGAGDAPLAAQRPAETPRREAPAALPTPDRARWERAERLVSIGLLREGSDRLTDLAEQRAGTHSAGLAWMRVAELRESAGDVDGAAEAYRRAAHHPALADAALLAAARCFNDRLRYAEALEALEASPTHHEQAQALRARLTGHSTQSDFARGLPEAWAVTTPLGVQPSPSLGGLSLRLNEGVEALRAPLHRVDGYTRVAITLLPQRLDWSWTLHADLQSEAGAGSLRWLTHGGGDQQHFSVACGAEGESFPFAELDLAEQTAPLTLVYEHLDGEPWANCVLWRGDEELARNGVKPIPLPPTGAPLTLTFRTEAAYHFVGEVVLQRVDLDGLRLEPAAPTPLERAYFMMLRGRSAEAEALLAELPGAPAAFARALVAEDRRDAAQAAAALSEALALDPELGGALAGLLLLHPQRLDAPLRALLEAQHPETVGRAYAAQLELPADLDRDATLVDLLEGLEERAACCLSPDSARHLLAQRAAALRRLGRAPRAEADLRQALSLPLGPDPDRLTLATLHVELAQVQLSTGHEDEAAASVLRALEASPVPELLADRLASSPGLAALHSAPAWARVLEVRRGG